MLYKTVSLILPVTTLLVGAKPIEDVDFPISLDVSYKDQVDIIVVDAIEHGRVSNIELTVSFVAFRASHTFKLYRKNPITDEYELKGQTSSSDRLCKVVFPYIEEYPISVFDINDKNNVEFKFVYTSDSSTFEKTFTSSFSEYEQNNITLNPYHKNTNVLETGSKAYYYKTNMRKPERFSEKYTFDDKFIEGFYDFPNQNYIDFNMNLFKYTGVKEILGSEFTYDSVSVTVLDTYNLFPLLNEGSTLFTLNGKLIPYDGYYKFQLTDDLYLDPSTRLTQRVHKMGYLPVNKLFLPLNIPSNYEVNENRNFFTFAIRGVGHNNASIIMKMDLGEPNRNLIGDCATSSFCVTSEMSEPDFEYAKVEEINAQ